MNGQRTLAALVISAGLLVTASCSSSGGGATTITGPNGEKVEVDSNGNVKASDGKGNSVSSDGSGSGSVSGSDGDTNYSSGAGTKLPSDWPDELKPPKQITLTSAITNTSGGKKNRIVSGETDVDAKDLYDGVKEQLTNADYEITGDTFSSGSSGIGGIISAKNSKYEVNVTIGNATTGTAKTTIVFAVTDAAG